MQPIDLTLTQARLSSLSALTSLGLPVLVFALLSWLVRELGAPPYSRPEPLRASHETAYPCCLGCRSGRLACGLLNSLARWRVRIQG